MLLSHNANNFLYSFIVSVFLSFSILLFFNLTKKIKIFSSAFNANYGEESNMNDLRWDKKEFCFHAQINKFPKIWWILLRNGKKRKQPTREMRKKTYKNVDISIVFGSPEMLNSQSVSIWKIRTVKVWTLSPAQFIE